MHLLHARLAAGGNTDDYHHPEYHNAVRDDRGMVVRWGTLDVVVIEFSQIASDYRELFNGSLLARYKYLSGAIGTDRFWGYYEAIQKFCEPPA